MFRRRVGSILLLVGSAALVWCLSVLGSAALFEWYASRQLDRTLKHPATAELVRPPRPPPRLHDVVGRLEIPRLNVSAVVLEGDDDRALRLGAGHVPWTPLPDRSGNVGIAAHRDTFFRPLRRLVANDRITFATPGGDYTYAVESTEIVHPNDLQVLDQYSTPELTLITCYPFYYVGPAPMRFVVHARRIR